MMTISVILHENVSFSFSAVTGCALDLGAGKNSWQHSRLDWETYIVGRDSPKKRTPGPRLHMGGCYIECMQRFSFPVCQP